MPPSDLDSINAQSRARAMQFGDDPDMDDIRLESQMRVTGGIDLYAFPWWMVVIIGTGIMIALAINANAIYGGIFEQLKEGIGMTLGVSFLSYFLALMIALIVGIIRSNPPQRPVSKLSIGQTAFLLFRTVVYNIATIYVQVMRGLPILVVLLATAFVVIPAVRVPIQDVVNGAILPPLRNLLNNPEIPDFLWRGSSPPSAVLALAFTYGAYMSETVRAGIQSISRGQIEASLSLGMTYSQTLRFIVLPQAIRNVLPPLGNDLIAMIKDSSLLAMLGIRDLTQVAKVSSGRSFRYMETYSILAVLYLTLTIPGSTLVKALEDTLRQEAETPDWVKEFQKSWAVMRGTPIEKPKRNLPRQHGLYLSAFLICILGVSVASLAFIFSGATNELSLAIYGDLTDRTTMQYSLLLLQIIVIASVIGTLRWSRWGYSALNLVFFFGIIGAIYNYNITLIFINVIVLRTLVYLTRDKTHWFA